MSSKLESRRPATGAKPGVIPTSQVIVLKEKELDCDLATAIHRIRACEETSHTRILVIAADEAETDLEAPATDGALIPVPTTLGQVSRRGQQQAVSALGEELRPLGTCLTRYTGELRAAIDQLVRELPADAASSCGASLRWLEEIAEWTRALAEDLEPRLDRARRGVQLVDTHEVMVEMAGQVEARFPRLRITVAPKPDSACVARPADLAEAFFLALVLVAQRIGGQGAIGVEFESAADGLLHRFVGSGEPRRVSAPETVARFRRLVVDQLGGRVLPDVLGASGTGLQLLLPR
jgi:hypothetical protein